MVTSQNQRTMPRAAPKPTIDELLDCLEQWNRVGAQFLKVDLQTALTFAQIASQSRDLTRRQRNRKAARKAYDTILRLIPKVNLSARDASLIEQGIVGLRIELQSLGETF